MSLTGCTGTNGTDVQTPRRSTSAQTRHRRRARRSGLATIDITQTTEAAWLALCREHPIFRWWRFFPEQLVHATKMRHGAWLSPDGTPMTDADWRGGHARRLPFLNGRDLRRSLAITGCQFDDSYPLLFNAHPEPVRIP